MSDPKVTQILASMRNGDPQASEQLLPLVYDELRRLAKLKMLREASGHTLQPTALVHEAYLRLVGQDGAQQWDNLGHFYAAAAEAMRRILIESARRKAGPKRGGEYHRVSVLEDVAAQTPDSPDSILALNEALERLKLEDEDSFKLVMLRYFGGLTIEEASASLTISARTANRIWSFARACLQREMDRDK